MKNIIFVCVFFTATLFTFIGFSQNTDKKNKHEYVGVKKCTTCHKSPKQGKQNEKWLKSSHSKSFTNLTGKKGLAKAKKLGVKDPANSKKCLSCHAPEFDKKTQWGSKFKLEEGVQCESCHGPGSGYKKKKIMKDQKTAIANGLIIPDEKTCLGCHKKNNREHKGNFDFKKALEKIKHPVPKKK